MLKSFVCLVTAHHSYIHIRFTLSTQSLVSAQTDLLTILISLISLSIPLRQRQLHKMSIRLTRPILLFFSHCLTIELTRNILNECIAQNQAFVHPIRRKNGSKDSNSVF